MDIPVDCDENTVILTVVRMGGVPDHAFKIEKMRHGVDRDRKRSQEARNKFGQDQTNRKTSLDTLEAEKKCTVLGVD